MSKKLLMVEISETLYDRLFRVAAVKGGHWRANNKENAQDALESAVETALRKFLDNLEELDKSPVETALNKFLDNVEKIDKRETN